MPNDAHAAHATRPTPIIIDGAWYPNIREAARAAGLTYNRLYDACRKHRGAIDGHHIAEPPRQYAIETLSGDEADLVPVFRPPKQPRPRKGGDPLLRYPPGEGPLERGHYRYY
jgi:hypothetical protein